MSLEVQVTNNNFEAEVKKADVAVLADFWASWCMPCKMMEPILAQLAQDYEGKIKVAKIDVDTEQELASQFGIVSIPTLILFHKGEAVNKKVGAVSRQVLDEMLKDYL